MKKEPNKPLIEKAGQEALALPAPAAPAQPEKPRRRRGRQPGARFPHGYGKDRPYVPPAGDPGGQAFNKPISHHPDPVNNGHSHKEDSPGETGGGGGEGEEPDAAAEGPGEAKEPYKIPDLKDSIERLVDVVFNRLLASRRGAHWKLTEDEVLTLAEPIAETIRDLIPNIQDNKWTYRATILAIILGPRLVRDLEIHPIKTRVRQAQPANHEKKEHPHQEKHPPGPGAPGAGKDITMQILTGATQKIGSA